MCLDLALSRRAETPRATLWRDTAERCWPDNRLFRACHYCCSGYQETTAQELAWNRGLLIMLSGAATIPLLAGWWYQCYENPPRAFLADNHPSWFSNLTALEVSQVHVRSGRPSSPSDDLVSLPLCS